MEPSAGWRGGRVPDQMVTAAVAAPGAQRQGPARASPQGWAVLDPTNSLLEEGRPSWSLLTEGDLGVDRVIRGILVRWHGPSRVDDQGKTACEPASQKR